MISFKIPRPQLALGRLYCTKQESSSTTKLLSQALFKRKREHHYFVDALSSKASKVLVLTGPPGAGKKTFLSQLQAEGKVIKGTYPKRYPFWFPVDCHALTVKAAVFGLLDKKLCTGKDITELFCPEEEEPLEGILEKTVEKLRRGTYYHENDRLEHMTYMPVLSFTGAERLFNFNNRNTKVQDAIINFIVRNTKECNNCHVVMSTTDSRCILEALDPLLTADVKTLGQLSEMEAREVWENHLPRCNSEVTLPKHYLFDDVYSIVGGHIGDLKEQYCNESCSIVDGTWAPRKYKYIKELVEELRENGFIPYKQAKKRFDAYLIDNMMRNNALFYQPTPQWTYDLPDAQPWDYPLLTTPTPAHVWALRNHMVSYY